jgi:hypothetical protein
MLETLKNLIVTKIMFTSVILENTLNLCVEKCRCGNFKNRYSNSPLHCHVLLSMGSFTKWSARAPTANELVHDC